MNEKRIEELAEQAYQAWLDNFSSGPAPQACIADAIRAAVVEALSEEVTAQMGNELRDPVMPNIVLPFFVAAYKTLTAAKIKELG